MIYNCDRTQQPQTKQACLGICRFKLNRYLQSCYSTYYSMRRLRLIWVKRCRNTVEFQAGLSSRKGMNKYVDSESDSDDDDDDIDIHEIVRSGTFDDVKEAIAIDRPRLIALKDEVCMIALI